MPDRSTTVRFNATLLRPSSPKAATWLFLVLPARASAKLPTRGRTTVDGVFGGHAFRSSLEPDGQGSHWLKVTRAMRESAKVAVGDTVALEIVPSLEQAEPRVPVALRNALAATPEAKATWSALTPAARADWIDWITSAKKAETRARRIANACSMLASGKRRVCCFDRSGIYSKGLRASEPAG